MKQRKKPELSTDAIPTIFPNLPGYLSIVLPKERRNPEDRRAALAERDDAALQQFLMSDCINCYTDFVAGVKDHVPSGQWNVASFDKTTCIYSLSFSDNLRVSVAIAVSDDMTARLCIGDKDCSQRLSSLTDCNKLTRWSQLDNILSRHGDYTSSENNIDVSARIREICDELDSMCKVNEGDGERVHNLNVSCISFCAEQMRLM